MKLLWDGKWNRFIKVERFMPWLCIYGMDKQSIKDCLENRTTRTEAANNSIAKYINHEAINQIALLVMSVKLKCREKELA